MTEAQNSKKYDLENRTFDFEEFKEFIKEQQLRLDERYPISDKEKAIFAQLVKLTEEQGELADAVLSYLGFQRKNKPQKNKEEVAEELADVLVCLGLIAEKLDIDLKESLESKIAKLQERKV